MNTNYDEKCQSQAEETQQEQCKQQAHEGAESCGENTETPASEETASQAEISVEEQIAALEAKIKGQQDDYLRLMAEFDNFRKRTLKEKQDLHKYGAEETVKKLLPVIDDFERAIQHNEQADDIEAVKEGFNLIYQKFQSFLSSCKISEIPAAQGDAFDEEIHDAMTMFPAPDESLKGKIIDCPTKGYKLEDKVIRFAKVVVGQ